MGNSDKNNVDIRYRKPLPRGRQTNSINVANSHNASENIKNDLEKHYARNIKVLSIIFILLSLLVLISIVTYSPKDEFVLNWGLRDFWGLVKGDDSIIQRTREVSNLMGTIGALVANFFVNKTIGYFSILLPFLVIIWGIKLFLTQKVTASLIWLSVIILSFGILLSSFVGGLESLTNIGIPYYFYGLFGAFISQIASYLLGKVGSIIFFVFALLITTIIAFDLKVEKFFAFVLRVWKENLIPFLKSFKKTKTIAKTEEGQSETPLVSERDDDFETASILITHFENDKEEEHFYTEAPKIGFQKNEQDKNEFSSKLSTSLSENEHPERRANESEHLSTPSQNKKLIVYVEESEELKGKGADEEVATFNPISTSILDEKINYTPPPLDLLIDDENKFKISEEELKYNAKLLQEKLETFKIYIENLTVIPGPVVTQYEFVPAPGIKISRIESLADDIALGLKAKGIRIIAPVPGKGTVGIEIPNKNPLVVRFGNCLRNARNNPNLRLPIILGKTVSGEVHVDDLAKMPHLLIAGATGSGKSVGINTIIASLIYKMHPQHLKFVIIDPKKVELTHYQQLLYHYLAVSPEVEDAIVTEPTDAVLILKSLVAEMQLRYDILYSVQQKNIVDYNRKVSQGLFKNNKDFVYRPMPYIVVIIDELADLMLTTGKEIEGLIIRLAQLARAVGIHLVVATQRPSVDIITGLIKANFPARISYLVASRVDSRTIIDTIGAEQLLGNGDMLFLPNGSPTPIRIQNPFLTVEEIESICEFIGNQKGYSQPYYLPSIDDSKTGKEGWNKNGVDSLFEEAAYLIVRTQQASVSMIQRRLKVGYNRAGRIMDELEAAGIVSAFDGSKGRTVKIASEEDLEKFLREKMK